MQNYAIEFRNMRTGVHGLFTFEGKRNANNALKILTANAEYGTLDYGYELEYLIEPLRLDWIEEIFWDAVDRISNTYKYWKDECVYKIINWNVLDVYGI